MSLTLGNASGTGSPTHTHTRKSIVYWDYWINVIIFINSYLNQYPGCCGTGGFRGFQSTPFVVWASCIHPEFRRWYPTCKFEGIWGRTDCYLPRPLDQPRPHALFLGLRPRAPHIDGCVPPRVLWPHTQRQRQFLSEGLMKDRPTVGNGQKRLTTFEF